MPLSPCHQLVTDLKAQIDARMLGREVQSVGHKNRNLSYSDRPTKELIAYYNQIRRSCPDALADPELIELADPEQPAVTRGRAGVRHGRPWV